MAALGLFGGGRTSRAPPNLIEFKAGKMYLSGSMCHADKRKGLLYAFRGEDSLVHVCWKDRTSGLVQDDLIVFPEDAVFKRVQECTSGRVYVLLLKSSAKKLIFWMQEAKVDKDEENSRKLNEILSGAMHAESSVPAGGSLPDLANESDLQSLLNSLNQQQLLRLLGSATNSMSGWQSAALDGRSQTPSPSMPSRSTRSAGVAAHQSLSASTRAANTSTGASVGAVAKPGLSVVSTPPGVVISDSAVPTAGSSVANQRSSLAAGTSVSGESTLGHCQEPTAAHPPAESIQNKTPSLISLGDLKNILSSIKGAAGELQYGLSDALHADSVVPLLAADTQAVQLLIGHLPQHGLGWPPQDADAVEELRSTLSAPQFVQALASFSSAFSSGQLAPVIGQFQLPEPCLDAANRGDLENFANALQEHCTSIKNLKRKSESDGH